MSLYLHFIVLNFLTGAVGYYETSALTSSGVSEAMMAALRAVLSATDSRSSRRKFTWPWKRYRYAQHHVRSKIYVDFYSTHTEAL